MPLPAVIALDGVVRNYAWGSPTAIPSLLGVEPDGQPVAELWFGAHPDDPSSAPEHRMSLDEVIAADPPGLLGAANVERFGPHLPFLLKVLAAQRALSIQVHPTLEQARAGFAAEQAAGVPRDDPHRRYRDANHKPELLFALTHFEALCGFRPVPETVRLLDSWGVAELRVVRDLLAGDDGLRAAFTHLVSLPNAGPLVTAVLAAARRVPAGSQWAGAARAAVLAGTDVPGDIGVVLSLLLNYLRLDPGEAIYLGAGNVHAYLRGTGVEVMANSDNVLRCGLTGKHIDVPELVKITDFTALDTPRWPGEPAGFGERFVVPEPDFVLGRIDLDAHAGSCTVSGRGPHIVLCTTGHGRVAARDDAVELTPGRAAFVAARDTAFTVSGTGIAFAATTAFG